MEIFELGFLLQQNAAEGSLLQEKPRKLFESELLW
jgi:hypothetical protein